MRLLPTETYFGDHVDKMSEKTKEAILKKYGLTDPIPVQLAKYIKSVFKGDLGDSITYYASKPVTEVIAPKISYSLRFGIVSLAISLVLGIGLACLWSDAGGICRIISETDLFCL